MKIAIIANSFIPMQGGAQVFTYHLAKRLAEKQHSVDLLVPRFIFNQYQRLGLKEKFKVCPIFFQELRMNRYCPDVICKWLSLKQRFLQYDVWQVIGAYPMGCHVRGFAKTVPVILHSYGQDIQKDPTIGYGDRLDPKIEKKIREILKRFCAVVAVTPTVEDCFRSLDVPEDKIINIPYGVELARFCQNVDKQKVRRSLGIAEDEIFILTTGRYHKKKGFEYIPAAARHLFDKGFKIRWFVVGTKVNKLAPFIEEQKMQRVVMLKDGIGLSKAVVQNDRVSLPSQELIDMYKAADVYVAPSLVETFGIVLIEAMAAGVPVVTTDAPGCRDVVTDEKTGLFAETADSISLATCIERLIHDRDLREKIKENAYRYVQQFDWSMVADKYENLYLKLTACQ